jgi:hypothetical protein
MERYPSRVSVGMTRLDITQITCRGRPLNISTGAVITTISGQRENTVSEFYDIREARERIAQLEAVLRAALDESEDYRKPLWRAAARAVLALDQRPAERHT